jgi:parallel beta-helix repeat protein
LKLGERIELLRKTVSGIMLTLLLIGMLTLAFNIQPVKTKPTTIIVPDDYPTIQEAVVYANEGNTIFVRNGTYYESVVVYNNSVSLIGENKETTIIDGGGVTNVTLTHAGNNTIMGFTIRNSELGGLVINCPGNRISGNNIANNYNGIYLISEYSSNNVISGNNIKNNEYGICLDYSNSNFIYHNNFVNNTSQVYNARQSVNIWDNGYPSGGNYWSDYAGKDVNGDGIGDTPYVIDNDNIDHYPLMSPWSSMLRDVAVTNVVASYTHVTVGESFSVYVTVQNKGTQTETFSVTAYFGSGKIGFDTKTVTLDADENRTLNIIWNTTGVFPNSYQIGAYATLAGDMNPGNNDLQDGYVTVVGLPYKPQDIVAKPLNNGINLTWNADPTRTDVTKYDIFRGTSPDFTVSWPPYNQVTTTQFDDSILDNTIYYYRVVAEYPEGCSIPSDPPVGCARLESLKGISTTLTGANSLSVPISQLYTHITFQQNFYLFTGKYDTNNNPIIYWCQNAVVKGMNGLFLQEWSQMEIRGPIVGWPANPPKDYKYRWIGLPYPIPSQPDKIDFVSKIDGLYLNMSNSVYSHSWVVNLDLSENAYIYTVTSDYPPDSSMLNNEYSKPPNFVLVGDFGGGTAYFNAGQGSVTCNTRIGNVWIKGTNIHVVDEYYRGAAATEEKSENLNWTLSGDFKHQSGVKEEGVFFVPDFTLQIVPTPLFSNIGNSMEALIVEAKCPVYVNVFDELGNCAGYNSTSGEIETQIEMAMWASNQTIYVFNPSGTYNVSVTGIENGTFTLQILYQNENGTTSIIRNSTSTITKNATQVYTIEVNNVTVMNISSSKTVIGQGFNLYVNATVMNQGAHSETFNITVYANATAISTQTITLTSGNSTTITFTWNTTSFAKGNYTIWAYAWPVQNETYTDDNTFVDGWAIVTIPGDINGDKYVNYLDGILLGAAFSSKPGDTNWNPNSDLNEDGYINYLDGIILGAYFGQTDP